MTPMRRPVAFEPAEMIVRPEPSRVDELIERLIDRPDSLNQAEMMELARGVLERLLRKRRQ